MFKKLRNWAKIILSGDNNTKETYYGGNVSIINGKVIVDGNDVTNQMKTLTIVIEGNIESLRVDACNTVTVNGNVSKIDMTSGNIKCNTVDGNINTNSGDIVCGDISGNVDSTSGDVTANKIRGDVSTTSGDIKTKN